VRIVRVAHHDSVAATRANAITTDEKAGKGFSSRTRQISMAEKTREEVVPEYYVMLCARRYAEMVGKLVITAIGR
jgi:hypothetical protein